MIVTFHHDPICNWMENDSTITAQQYNSASIPNSYSRKRRLNKMHESQLICSRVHGTLQPAMSIGQSVHSMVTVSFFLRLQHLMHYCSCSKVSLFYHRPCPPTFGGHVSGLVLPFYTFIPLVFHSALLAFQTTFSFMVAPLPNLSPLFDA